MCYTRERLGSVKMGEKQIDYLEEFKKKAGFREDFDFEHRFHLIDIIGGYRISTVDIGVDMSFGSGKPIYYETMIFNDKNDTTIGYMERYSTEKQARLGHQEAIQYVKEVFIKDGK